MSEVDPFPFPFLLHIPPNSSSYSSVTGPAASPVASMSLIPIASSLGTSSTAKNFASRISSGFFGPVAGAATRQRTTIVTA